MITAKVRPTVTEWGEMPYPLQQAFPLVYKWSAELEREETERERRVAERRGHNR